MASDINLRKDFIGNGIPFFCPNIGRYAEDIRLPKYIVHFNNSINDNDIK